MLFVLHVRTKNYNDKDFVQLLGEIFFPSFKEGIRGLQNKNVPQNNISKNALQYDKPNKNLECFGKPEIRNVHRNTNVL